MIENLWDPNELSRHLNKHFYPGWQSDGELRSVFASRDRRAPFSAVVLDLDIRSSTALMKETHDFYGFGLDLGNFFDVMKQEVHGNKGCFDKFTGDGCISYWPYKADDRTQFELAISRAYRTARNAIRSFQSIQIPKFRRLVRNMPESVSLSAGLDAGELYLAVISDDMTILGLPVVGAVRMLEKAPPGKIVANVQIGEFVVTNEIKVSSSDNWLGVGEGAGAKEAGEAAPAEADRQNVVSAERVSLPTKEYPQGQTKYILSEIQCNDEAPSTS